MSTSGASMTDIAIRVENLSKQYPSTGSGRRLGPEILLVDEVLAVGDATPSSHCDTLTRTAKLS